MADTYKQQNYFSALARGGLTAAMNYNKLQGRQSISQSTPIREETGPKSSRGGKPTTNVDRSRDSSHRKTNSQDRDNSYSNIQQHFQTHPLPNYHRNNSKLQLLMTGNDLQPLEEEVSREEDESFVIQVEVSKPNRQNQVLMQNQSQQKASTTSLESCNYNGHMEEADVVMVGDMINGNSIKIFDAQYSNSSYDNTQNSIFNHKKSSIKGQQDYNQQQKAKAQQILEQMRTSRSTSPQPVEQRLFDYQKKTLEKLEQMKQVKESQELSQLRPVPQITQKSNEIILRKSMLANSSPNKQSPVRVGMFSPPDMKSYYEEQKKKEEDRLKQIQDQEMKGFTGKPIINKKSQSISRKIDDLMDWKTTQELKRQEELKRKVEKENQEMQQLQQTKVVNKKSEQLLEYKRSSGHKKERVEDRLLRDAVHRQKKQVETSKMFTVKDLESQQKGRNRSKSQKTNKLKLKEVSPKPKGTTLQANTHNDMYSTLQPRSQQQSDEQLYLTQSMNFHTQQQLQHQYQLSHRVHSQHYNSQQQNESPLVSSKLVQSPSYQNITSEQMCQSSQYLNMPTLSPISYYSQPATGKTSLTPTNQNFSQYSAQMTQMNQVKNQAFAYEPQFFRSCQQSQQQNIQSQKQQQQPPTQQQSNKKKPQVYESLFSKVQKMNTSSQSLTVSEEQAQQQNHNYSTQQASSTRQSIPFVSALSPLSQQQQYQQEQQVLNPIYQSIQLDYQRMNNQQHPQPQYPQFQPLVYPQQNFYHTQQVNHMMPEQNTQVLNYTLPKSSLTYEQLQQLSFQNQQDVIINKILENSYIPTGNVMEQRRNSLRDDEDSTVYQYQQQLNPKNPNNQAQILDTEFSQVSDQTNVVKNLTKMLQVQDQQQQKPQLTERLSPRSQLLPGEDSKLKNLSFMDRNSKWLEIKNSKLNKAKEILEEREERQCTFKPQISQHNKSQVRQATRSRSQRSYGVKSPSSNSQSVTTKETKEEGVQVELEHDKNLTKNYSNQSSHTTNKINEAIAMMNFEDGERNIVKYLNNNDSRCDISSLSPDDAKGFESINQSNFDTSSFMSVAGEESRVMVRPPITGPVKAMNSKMMHS